MDALCERIRVLRNQSGLSQAGFADRFKVLPETIDSVIADGKSIKVPEDTVFDELQNISKNTDLSSDELSMAMAIYLLGFNTYNGFSKDGGQLNKLYEYATRIGGI